MTPADVRERVKAIAALAGDPETAHLQEDRLWHEVLERIALGAEEPSRLAAEALETAMIEFPRWFA
jgi:hypothetical protein